MRLHVGGLFLISMGLVCHATLQCKIARADESRPNFLFIITDDQSPDTLSAYGNSVCETPNLDRLANEGMVIHDAHHMGAWAGAVCRPSRTMVMTGRTVWRIPGANGPGLSFPSGFAAEAAQDSMPAVFNRAGYDTFRTCKASNTFGKANAHFKIKMDATKRLGTEEGGSAWHGDQVMDFLQQREDTGDVDPFLIYFGFSHPHDPRHATPELADKYGADNNGPGNEPNPNSPPLPINYLPEHPFHHGHPNLRDEERVQGVMGKRDEATVRNETGREYACIENIDAQIGRVLDKLATMGELDNTYVFFTSDHGIAVGRHGLMGKQNLYEHSWRVPFIARGPGIESGSQAAGYTYLLDVLPTMCDLAGIETPSVVEGKSFRPVLEGDSDRIRDVLYGVYSGGTKPGIRAIKSDGWKLIKYDVLDGEVRKTQLFNLNDNPQELLAEHHDPEIVALLNNDPAPNQINLADDPAYATKRLELERLLTSEMVRLGDPYIKQKTNIVVVLFDDLGYGEVKSFRKKSIFKTPNFDRLRKEGMRFLDAHSASSIGSPSRYGLLTGCYPSRIGQFESLDTNSPPIIPPGQTTLASFLKQEGYHTACIGKWHLGQNWVSGNPQTITGGPTEVGFDYFYGVTGSDNIQTVIEQDTVVADVEPVENQPLMIAKALEYIGERAVDGGPFFLYMSICPPHEPLATAAAFVGSSGTKGTPEEKEYGDWIYQGDHMLGQLVEEIDSHGLGGNTIIIATSDNGALDREYKPLRGAKGSIYEGGHRVPFVARWTARIKARAVERDTICLNDVLATCADMLETTLPTSTCEDSVSFLPYLLRKKIKDPLREFTIHQAADGTLAIREGIFKLVFLKNGERELYNVRSDIGEKRNVISRTRYADVVDRLTSLMENYIATTVVPALRNRLDEQEWILSLFPNLQGVVPGL